MEDMIYPLVSGKDGLPVRKEVLPARKEVLPVCKEVLPVRKEVLPVRKERLPVRKEVLPGRKEVLTECKEVLPVPKEVLPVRKEVLGLGLGKRGLRTAPCHDTQHSTLGVAQSKARPRRSETSRRPWTMERATSRPRGYQQPRSLGAHAAATGELGFAGARMISFGPPIHTKQGSFHLGPLFP